MLRHMGESYRATRETRKSHSIALLLHHPSLTPDVHVQARETFKKARFELDTVTTDTLIQRQVEGEAF